MTLLADVSEHIRADVAAGRLALGERVTIDDLSHRYGTSHMPVREALRRLTGEGLVAMEPGRGARIRTVDRGLLSNLFDTRGALEATLSRAAALDCTPLDIEDLTRIEFSRKRCVDERDYPAALALNRRFHATIHRIGRNPQASELIERTWVLILALWHRYGYGEDRFAGVASDHLNLVRALEAHDSDAASILTGAHVIKAKYHLLAQIAAEDVAPSAREKDRR